MVWMTLFHLAFDLGFLGYWQQNFLTYPLWTLQRTCIVGLFLWCAGLGQAMARDQRQSWQRFVRRWVQTAGCALLVTAASWAVFPDSFIHFGVLHGLAVMLLLARATADARPVLLWLAGAVALALPSLGAWALNGPLHAWSATFNAPSLNWLGLVTHKPFTEDYVPLLPWMGILWWGMAAGQWLLAHHPQWVATPVASWLQPLATLGRWSLAYYMLHQPVLLGVLWMIGAATGRSMH